MKTFTNQCAQGDVLFRRLDRLPDGIAEQQPVGNRVVVTHSETGHHHVMPADRVRMFRLDGDGGAPGMISYLDVSAPAVLEHLRPHDTHAPILFAPGVYEVRRQREYTPEGWRRVED